MKPAADWLSAMMDGRTDDFAPEEIEKARAFVEAIQRDALAPPRPALVAIFQKIKQMRMLDEADAKQADDICAMIRALFYEAGP